MTDCLVKQESPTPERRIALMLAANLDHFERHLDPCRGPSLPSAGGGVVGAARRQNTNQPASS